MYYMYHIFFSVAPGAMKLGGATMTSQRKMGTPNPMTLAAKMEHSLVCQTIKEVICPRMTEEVGDISVMKLALYTVI